MSNAPYRQGCSASWRRCDVVQVLVRHRYPRGGRQLSIINNPATTPNAPELLSFLVLVTDRGGMIRPPTMEYTTTQGHALINSVIHAHKYKLLAKRLNIAFYLFHIILKCFLPANELPVRGVQEEHNTSFSRLSLRRRIHGNGRFLVKAILLLPFQFQSIQ